METVRGQDQMSGARWKRTFFSVWTAQAASLLGSNLVGFALVWWLTETTGSAVVLAVGTIVTILPQIVLSPFAGAVVDRRNRRVVLIAADTVIALATAALALLYALDVVQIWHIYLVVFIRATGGAFHWPAMQASTTLMVPQRHLSRIAGMNQALAGIANIAAPPLGALLLQVLPLEGILTIDVATALLAVAPLFFVSIPQPERVEAPDDPRSSVLKDLREGLRFVWGWSGLMMILAIATVLNLLTFPPMALQPILITEHFKGGAPELAGMQSAWGVGMVLGGITLSVWGGFRRRVVTGLLAIALQGIGVAMVGLAPANYLPLAVGAMLFMGVMNPIGNGSLLAVLQVAVPPEMQGRVFTLVLSGATAMAPLGLAVAGPAAEAFGVRSLFVVAGVGTLVLGAGALFVPAIMHIEDRAVIEGTGQPELRRDGTRESLASTGIRNDAG